MEISKNEAARLAAAGVGARILRGLMVAGLSLAAASGATSQSDHVRGSVRITDGDTLRMGELRIRMHGIDAPERAQPCFRRGDPWRCGMAAKEALVGRIGLSSVDCVVKDVDRYRRLVAECFIGGQSLNRWMVAQGWAVAYRTYSLDYVNAEATARAARRGIWATRFEMPWDWRKARRRGR